MAETGPLGGFSLKKRPKMCRPGSHAVAVVLPAYATTSQDVAELRQTLTALAKQTRAPDVVLVVPGRRIDLSTKRARCRSCRMAVDLTLDGIGRDRTIILSQSKVDDGSPTDLEAATNCWPNDGLALAAWILGLLLGASKIKV